MTFQALIGPLFLYHSESESSAVFVLVISRLAANSLAISFGVLSPSVMPSLSTTADSRSYSLSVILQPTVRLRIWSAGMEEGLRGSFPRKTDGLLIGEENQQVNGERPRFYNSRGANTLTESAFRRSTAPNL